MFKSSLFGRRSFRPIVAPHDRDAAIDDQRLFVRDPGTGIDPYRDAGGGERANAFLEIARRTTIGDEADTDAAGMRSLQRRRDAGPARVAMMGGRRALISIGDLQFDGIGM